MASAAQRGSLWGIRKDKVTARAAGATAKHQHSLEHRILITATMCLLAFGAVMVYSASSATTLLQGRGNGSGYLIKYVMYGAVGLVLMRVLARACTTTQAERRACLSARVRARTVRCSAPGPALERVWV
jgi:hypothetical protein